MVPKSPENLMKTVAPTSSNTLRQTVPSGNTKEIPVLIQK